MDDCKNAEYYGYKVGDEFKYKSRSESMNYIFDINDVLILDNDDGTSCPRFVNQNGFRGYESLRLLEKIEETTELDEGQQEGVQEVTSEVTTSTPAAIQEMLLASFDDKISVEISMDSIKVKWRGLTFVVDEEVSLEQILNAVNLLSEQQVEG